MKKQISVSGRSLFTALFLLLLPDIGSVTAGAAEDRAARTRGNEASGGAALPAPAVTNSLPGRLAAAGVSLGRPLFIRIFKKEAELEVWIEKDKAYVLFASYPVCNWSGSLGPKLREGDLQTPEGFYTIGLNQLHFGARWPRSLDLGYPNIYDRIHGRTGSSILLHGGCESKGCFAMTDTVSAELYELVSAALNTTGSVPVHVFPFRMTEANVAAHANSLWRDFWTDLQRGYDAFERTRLPPRITVCSNRYHAEEIASLDAAVQTVSLCEEDQLELGLRIAAGDTSAALILSAASPDASRKTASVPALKVRCNRSRPSCKKWIALRTRKMAIGLSSAAR